MNGQRKKLNNQSLGKETILLKISGASLRSEQDRLIVSTKKIEALVSQIIKISKKYHVAIVVGGGNIWRGEFGNGFQLAADQSDYMGMLATVLNANLLKAMINKHGLAATVFSALHVEGTINEINSDVINRSIKQSICIFAGGIGEPYFTTDTTAVLRAIQVKAKKILIGKNGVNGVYSSDPKKGGKPIFFEKLSYDYAVSNSLKVMDKTAFLLASEHNLEMVVFNIDCENGILNALKINASKLSRTIISSKGE